MWLVIARDIITIDSCFQSAAWFMSVTFILEKRISWKHVLIRMNQNKFWAETWQHGTSRVIGAGVQVTHYKDFWAGTWSQQKFKNQIQDFECSHLMSMLITYMFPNLCLYTWMF